RERSFVVLVFAGATAVDSVVAACATLFARVTTVIVNAPLEGCPSLAAVDQPIVYLPLSSTEGTSAMSVCRSAESIRTVESRTVSEFGPTRKMRLTAAIGASEK